jgi:hypothetical protein
MLLHDPLIKRAQHRLHCFKLLLATADEVIQ